MEARDVSVPQLVERSGAFSTRTVTRWRSGTTAPGVEALPLLSRTLRVPIGWLCGEGSNDVPNPT